MNIVDAISARCDRSAVALIYGNLTLSFGELIDLTETAAAALQATGFFATPHLRVGLYCPNGVEHVLFSPAVLRAGGCLVPVPGELTPRERDELVTSTAVDIALIAGASNGNSIASRSCRS